MVYWKSCLSFRREILTSLHCSVRASAVREAFPRRVGLGSSAVGTSIIFLNIVTEDELI